MGLLCCAVGSCRERGVSWGSTLPRVPFTVCLFYIGPSSLITFSGAAFSVMAAGHRVHERDSFSRLFFRSLISLFNTSPFEAYELGGVELVVLMNIYTHIYIFFFSFLRSLTVSVFLIYFTVLVSFRSIIEPLSVPLLALWEIFKNVRFDWNFWGD